MKTKLTLLLLSISFLWCSCDDKKDKNTSQETSGEATENNISDFEMPSVINNNFDYKVFKKVEPYLLDIKKYYDTVPYFFVIDTNYYFYVVNGEWTEPSNDTSEKKIQYKVGLVNKFNKTIIPVEYNKIYNPNGTAIGYVEVEKEGKRGLYNISGLKIAPARYDYIYPSPIKTAIIQVRLGNKFGLLKSNGMVDFDGDSKGFQSPYVSEVAEKWSFNILKNIVHLQPASNNFEEDVIDGRGVVFTPSYLLELGFIPESFGRIATTEDSYFGLVEAKASVTEVKSWWDNISTVFTEYYERSIDGRGYTNERSTLYTYSTDEAGKKIDKIEYKLPEFYGYVDCGEAEEKFKLKVKRDSFLEVRQFITPYEYPKQKADTSMPYDFYPYYSYFKVTNKGAFEELSTDRKYKFTKYVKIDESYFKGCFGLRDYSNISIDGYISEHLSMKEMEIMKNEIFADYGMIFKTEKWKKYFSDQIWYMGLEENVNDQLTEIDKHNIKVITGVINKMKNNPDEYIKKRKGQIAFPP